MIWVVIIFGIISAFSWLASAVLSPVITATYFDGPPPALVRRMKLGSALNAVGAAAASISIGAQTFIIATGQ